MSPSLSSQKLAGVFTLAAVSFGSYGRPASATDAGPDGQRESDVKRIDADKVNRTTDRSGGLSQSFVDELVGTLRGRLSAQREALPPAAIFSALVEHLERNNPTATERQIRSILHSVVQLHPDNDAAIEYAKLYVDRFKADSPKWIQDLARAPISGRVELFTPNPNSQLLTLSYKLDPKNANAAAGRDLLWQEMKLNISSEDGTKSSIHVYLESGNSTVVGIPSKLGAAGNKAVQVNFTMDFAVSFSEAGVQRPPQTFSRSRSYQVSSAEGGGWTPLIDGQPISNQLRDIVRTVVGVNEWTPPIQEQPRKLTPEQERLIRENDKQR